MTHIEPAAHASASSRPLNLGEPSPAPPSSYYFWHSGTDTAAIQRAVCEHFDLPAGSMTNRVRFRRVGRPRQIGMYLARKLIGLSYSQIGRRFGWRDHSTAMDSVKAVEKRIAEDDEVAGAVAAIERRLGGSAQ